MVKIGENFEPFEMDAYIPKKGSVEKIKLSDYQGKWLMIFYYPADFTFVCPTELKDISDSQKSFEKNGYQVLVISTDTVYSHKAWLEKEKLLQNFSFPMGADHDGSLAKRLNIFNRGSGVADRATYIIDPDGILRSIEIVAENIGRSASEAIRKLTALDYVRKNPSKACPANWNSGDKDLKPNIEIAGNIYKELN